MTNLALTGSRPASFAELALSVPNFLQTSSASDLRPLQYRPQFQIWTSLSQGDLDICRWSVATAILGDESHLRGYFQLGEAEIEELVTEPASMRGHIVNAHLSAAVTGPYGVPQRDIQILSFLNTLFPGQFRMEWAVEKICCMLEGAFTPKPDRGKVVPESTPERHVAILIKTLRTVEAEGLATVDWSRVSRAYPECHRYQIDGIRDCTFRDFNSTTGVKILVGLGFRESQARRKVGGTDLRPVFGEPVFDDGFRISNYFKSVTEYSSNTQESPPLNRNQVYLLSDTRRSILDLNDQNLNEDFPTAQLPILNSHWEYFRPNEIDTSWATNAAVRLALLKHLVNEVSGADELRFFDLCMKLMAQIAASSRSISPIQANVQQ